ncbi:MAG: alanine--glyoxylate aminotransferase family protein [Acidobacteriota bacterium]
MTETPAVPPTSRPSERLLMGPGPSGVPARVLEALSRPTLGHLDPEYLTLMDETGDMLRHVFGTENALTLAVSGTGSAGMEACLVNLLEPGDTAIVCVNGVFGTRMREVARRCGATVHSIEVPWGETIDPAQVEEALKAHPETSLFGLVHAETSTGAHQPMDEIAELVKASGAFFVADTVTSLSGHPVTVDAWGIDACYSGTQKCLSCPPGLAPVTFSARAQEHIRTRKTPVQSWYLDMSLIASYWGGERAYHHTAPVNMSYALHEALRIVLEEGLDARVARHRRHHLALRAGLEAFGLEYIPSHTLATLNAVRVPEGVDDARVRRALLEDFDIEIGSGLGPFKGQAWRIGLMGHSSSRRNVMLVLSALGELLSSELSVDAGVGVAAAAGAYAASS